MNQAFPRLRRTLMTADTIGGVWTYALELACALESFGIEVALATMGPSLTEQQREELRAVSNVELYESTYKLEWMEDPWDDVAAAGAWLLELERRVCPDLVHLNGYAHGALPWRAPRLIAGHSCVLSWWQAVHREAAPPKWRAYRDAVTAGLQAADLIVAPSRAMLAALEQHYGLFTTAKVIPNGRRLGSFQKRPKENCVLAAGRLWDKAKNIPALEAVASSLPWPVYVAGQEAHPLAPTPGMPGEKLPNVKCLGRLSSEELGAWLSRASIYALPARYEPFGLSALEAALAGCALVLGDIPSLREVWGDAAIFVPPESPEALREVLLELISCPPRLAAFADKARRAASSYTPERMAEGYLLAYEECLLACPGGVFP